MNIIFLTTAGDSETHKHTHTRIKMWNFIYSKFKENEIQSLKLISQLGASLSLFKSLLGFFIVERHDSDILTSLLQIILAVSCKVQGKIYRNEYKDVDATVNLHANSIIKTEDKYWSLISLNKSPNKTLNVFQI